MFLIYLGVKIVIQPEPFKEISKHSEKGMVSDFFTSFILIVMNPASILFFVAVFTGLGLMNTGTERSVIIPLVIGVFIGSGIWWVFLSSATLRLKKRISPNVLSYINLISGTLIIILALLKMVDMIE